MGDPGSKYKMWEKLSGMGYIKSDYNTWSESMEQPARRKQFYEEMKVARFYSKSYEEFENKFFSEDTAPAMTTPPPPSKKKEPAGSGSTSSASPTPLQEETIAAEPSPTQRQWTLIPPTADKVKGQITTTPPAFNAFPPDINISVDKKPTPESIYAEKKQLREEEDKKARQEALAAVEKIKEINNTYTTSTENMNTDFYRYQMNQVLRPAEMIDRWWNNIPDEYENVNAVKHSLNTNAAYNQKLALAYEEVQNQIEEKYGSNVFNYLEQRSAEADALLKEYELLPEKQKALKQAETQSKLDEIQTELKAVYQDPLTEKLRDIGTAYNYTLKERELILKAPENKYALDYLSDMERAQTERTQAYREAGIIGKVGRVVHAALSKTAATTLAMGPQIYTMAKQASGAGGISQIGPSDYLTAFAEGIIDDMEGIAPMPKNLQRNVGTSTARVLHDGKMYEVDFDKHNRPIAYYDNEGYPVSFMDGGAAIKKTIDSYGDELKIEAKTNWYTVPAATAQVLSDLAIQTTITGGASLLGNTAKGALIASRVGLVSAVAGQMAGGMYKDGLEMFGDTEEGREKTSRYALAASAAVGATALLSGLETRLIGINGETGFDKVIGRLIGSTPSVSSAARLITKGTTWKDAAKIRIITGVKEGIGEFTEESFVEQVSQGLVQMAFNAGYNSDFDVAENFSYNNIKNNGIVSFATGFLGGSVQSPTEKVNNLRDAAVLVAIENQEEYFKSYDRLIKDGIINLGGRNIAPDKLAKMHKDAIAATGAQVEAMQIKDPEQKAKVAGLMFNRNRLDQAKQSVKGTPLEKQIDDQIAEIDSFINSIITPTASAAPVTGTPPGTPPVTPPGTPPGTPPVTPEPGTPPVTPEPGTPPVTPAPGTPPVTPEPGTPPVTPEPGTPPVTPEPGTPPVTPDEENEDTLLSDFEDTVKDWKGDKMPDTGSTERPDGKITDPLEIEKARISVSDKKATPKQKYDFIESLPEGTTFTVGNTRAVVGKPVVNENGTTEYTIDTETYNEDTKEWEYEATQKVFTKDGNYAGKLPDIITGNKTDKSGNPILPTILVPGENAQPEGNAFVIQYAGGSRRKARNPIRKDGKVTVEIERNGEWSPAVYNEAEFDRMVKAANKKKKEVAPPPTFDEISSAETLEDIDTMIEIMEEYMKDENTDKDTDILYSELKKKKKEIIDKNKKAQTVSNAVYTSRDNKYHVVKNEKGVIDVVSVSGEAVSEAVKDRVLFEQISSQDINAGERAEIIDTDENSLNSHIAETSGNLVELASLFLELPPEPQPISDHYRAIAEYGFTTTEQSFNRFNDANNITPEMRKAYFKKDGQSLDDIADEMSAHYGFEITPEQIAEFMIDFPRGTNSAEALQLPPAATKARDRFYDLTGINLTPKKAQKLIEMAFEQLKENEDAEFYNNLINQEFENEKELTEEYWKAYAAAYGYTKESDPAEIGETGTTEEEEKTIDDLLPPDIKPPTKPEPKERTEEDDLFDDFKNAFNDWIGPNSGIIDQEAEKQAKMLIAGGKLLNYYFKQGLKKFKEIVDAVVAKMGRKDKDILRALKMVYGAEIMKGTQGLDPFELVAAFEFLDEPAQSPKIAFVNAVSDAIKLRMNDSTLPLGIVQLRDIAKRVGFNYSFDTELQEYAELAIVNMARQIIKDFGANALPEIMKLYNAQPTISRRDSNRIELQQYSTPIPMAYAAGLFVGHNTPFSVLEPSAGNGMLTIALPKNTIIANEYDQTRADVLAEQEFPIVLRQDAAQPFDIAPVDGVIMNPPFGPAPAKTYPGGFKIGGKAEQMALNALDAMKPDGKAAIIIGGHTTYDANGKVTGNDMIFLNYLYSNFNVIDVINMDGGLYYKQGTTFPTRMVLISGKKAQPDNNYAPRLENANAEPVITFHELHNRIIKAIQNDLLQSQNDADPDSRETTDGGADNTTTNNGGSGGTGTKTSGGRNSGGGGKGGGRRPNDGGLSGDTDGEPDGDAVPDNTQPPISEGDTPPETTDTTTDETTGDGNLPGDRPSGDTKPPERVFDLSQEKTPYVPASKGKQIGSVMPTKSAIELQKVLESFPDIDAYVQEKLGYKTKEDMWAVLAAEQVDGVALAIYQIERGSALIIGDMTGVGKGRQAAAIIRYAVRQGLQPIFITEKPTLFTDIYNDLIDIGSGNLIPFIMNSKDSSNDPTMFRRESGGRLIPVHKPLPDNVKKGIFKKRLPKEFNFIATTYSQVNSSKPTDKKEFLSRMAAGSIIIMDESHNAAGDSNTGAYIRGLIDSSKGVVFLSGTYAKTPTSMVLYAAKSDLGKSGISLGAIINAVKSGGVVLQEIMSASLSKAGQLIRRERDMTGVVTSWEVMDNHGQKHIETFNAVAKLFTQFVTFQNTYVNPIISAINDNIQAGKAEERKGLNEAGVGNTPFANTLFNAINQLLLATKAKEIAAAVIEEIKAGRKPVIGLHNTMGSFLNDLGLSEGDIIQNPDYSQVLKKYLRNLLRYTEVQPNGDKVVRYIDVADYGIDGVYAEMEELIDTMTSGVSFSPIDAIMHEIRAAGYTVNEMTGRDTALLFNKDGSATVTNINRPSNTQLAADFNSGRLDVLILNSSGSTGISLHASEKFQDQRQRVMICAQLQLDVNVEVQLRGRIDRTGQLLRGAYRYLISAIPAEKRLMMMLRNKLKSLDANTTASAKNKISEVDVVDFMNKYGDKVVAEWIAENDELSKMMGHPLPVGMDTKTGQHEVPADKVPGAARKITGRVALLPVDKQEQFYNEVSEDYAQVIEVLNENNANDLESKVINLEAETKERGVFIEGQNKSNPFGGDTFIEVVEGNVTKKPLKEEDVRKIIDQNKASENRPHTIHLEQFENAINTALEAEVKKINDKLEKDIAAEKRALRSVNKKAKEEDKYSEEELKEIEAKAEKQLRDSAKFKIDTATAKSTMTLQRGRNYMNNMIVGKVYIIPATMDFAPTAGATEGMFLGFKADKKIKNLKSIKAIFATRDSRRKIEMPLSEQKFFETTARNSSGYLSMIKLSNWDKYSKNDTREPYYLITGNLIQAYEKIKGVVITYTTKNGDIKNGIVIPTKEIADSLMQSGTVPATELETLLSKQSVVTTNTADSVVLTFNKSYDGKITLTIPTKGKVFYTASNIQALTKTGRFEIKAGNAYAEIPVENLSALGKLLSSAPFFMSLKGGNITMKPVEDQKVNDEHEKIAYGSSGKKEKNVKKTVENASSGIPVATFFKWFIPRTISNILLKAKLKSRAVLNTFKEQGYIDFKGTEITSLQDVADLFAIHRSPFIEKLHVVLVKDGKVVGNRAWTSNSPSEVDATELGMVINDMMNSTGADGFYILHNHPSGNPTPSQADIRLTEVVAKLHPAMLGHIVLNHKHFSVITGDGKVSRKQFSQKQERLSLPTVTISQSNGEADLARVGSAILSDGQADAVVIYLDTKNRVAGFDILDEASANDQISKGLAETGTERFVIVSKNAAIEGKDVPAGLEASLLITNNGVRDMWLNSERPKSKMSFTMWDDTLPRAVAADIQTQAETFNMDPAAKVNTADLLTPEDANAIGIKGLLSPIHGTITTEQTSLEQAHKAAEAKKGAMVGDLPLKKAVMESSPASKAANSIMSAAIAETGGDIVSAIRLIEETIINDLHSDLSTDEDTTRKEAYREARIALMGIKEDMKVSYPAKTPPLPVMPAANSKITKVAVTKIAQRLPGAKVVSENNEYSIVYKGKTYGFFSVMEAYQVFSILLGSPKNASIAFNGAGISGIAFNGGTILFSEPTFDNNDLINRNSFAGDLAVNDDKAGPFKDLAKSWEEQRSTAKYKNLIITSIRAINAGVKSHNALISLLGKSGGTALEKEMIANAYREAEAILRQRAKPFEIFTDLTAAEKLRTDLQDGRYALYLLMKQLKEQGIPIPENDPYIKKEIETASVEYQINELRQAIGIVNYAKPENWGIKEESFIGRLNKAAKAIKSDKINFDTLSEFMYAMHAPEYNERVREIHRAQLEDKLDIALIKLKNKKALLAAATRIKDIAKYTRQVKYWQDKVDSIQDELLNGIIQDGSGMLDERAEMIINSFNPDEIKVLKEFAEEFTETIIIKRLTMLYDAGIIDSEEYNRLLSGEREDSNVIFQHYVPLFVDDDYLLDKFTNVGSSPLSPAKAIKGTERYDLLKRQPPLLTAIQQLASTMAAIQDNESKKQFAKIVQNNPHPSWKIVSQVLIPGPKVHGKETFQDFTDPNVKEYGIRYIDNGQVKYIYMTPVVNNDGSVTPHPVIQALGNIKGLNLGTAGKMWMTINGWYTKFSRSLITVLNPAFGIINIMRDTLTASVNLASIDVGANPVMIRAKFAANLAKSLAFLSTKPFISWPPNIQQAWIDAKENGFQMAWINYDATQTALEALQKDIDKGIKMSLKDKALFPFEAIAESVAVVGNFFENATRFATFLTAKEYGVGNEKAASIAKNITVNFEKKGAGFGKLINAHFLFANAGIQGVAREAQLLRTKEGLATLGALTFGAFAARMLFYGLAADDGDDWEKIMTGEGSISAERARPVMDDITSSNMIIIPNPANPEKPIMYPKPFGLTRLFIGLGENMADYIFGTKNAIDATNSTFSDMYQTINPVTGNSDSPLAWMPSEILRPVLEMGTNTSWKGNEIYRYYNEAAIPVSQFRENVPGMYIDLAKALDKYTQIGDDQDQERFTKSQRKKNEQYGINTLGKEGLLSVSPAFLQYAAEAYLFKGVLKEAVNLYELSTSDENAGDRNFIPIVRRLYPDYSKKQYIDLQVLSDFHNKPNILGLTEQQKDIIKEAYNTVKAEKMLPKATLTTLKHELERKYKIDL